ncbi:hypothetical protein Ddye_005920 [Dipteronia dyeriana]|uniref:Reverse transcriptase zinc-binding domain-containing protein n=1 Tax=Dipteronia dyeriana TaxID=168575 RepID=A0AAD9XHK6_9ROSI|nr:hypothetical protein Ddye_005920 [Dipteronia dyeriana]
MAGVDCPLCKSNPEAVDHLFLLCPWSWELWTSCKQWWEVSSCTSKSISEWLHSWNGLCPSLNRKRVWNTLFFAIVWTIWEAHNNEVFKDKAANLSVSLDSVKFRVTWWFKNFSSGSDVAVTLLMLDLKERCIDKTTVKVPSSIVWSPPVDEDLLFNVDGSTRGSPGMAGVGGVLRDSREF